MDHIGQIKRKPNPREGANILSLVSFSYTGKLFHKAYKKDLEEEDIYEVVDVCSSKRNGDFVEKKLMELKEKGSDSVVRLLWNCFGLSYITLGSFHLCFKLLLTWMEPEALSKLISFFNPATRTISLHDAYYYAGVMIGLKFFHAFYLQNYGILLQQLSIRIRTSFCSLVYRKSLRMTPTALNEISLGNIITVITKDVMSFEQSTWVFNEMCIELIRIGLICYLIYNKMGVASFLGLGVLFLMVPIQLYVGRVVKRFRLQINKTTDERLQATQETLSAIKIIKMYTWESLFADKITEKRGNEMRVLLKSFILKSANMLCGTISSKISFYLLIIAYIWLNDFTSAEVIFYVMNCFKDLKQSIGFMIPMGLAWTAELSAATDRIKKVLNADELEPTEKEIYEKPKLEVHKATVQIKDKEILKNINVEIKSGLTVVTGTLGCGKSALIKLFMKDYPLVEGEVVSKATLSYSSQDPWLFPSSIKQNIIFGEPYNDTRYHNVVKACALDYDFSLLERGDETIVADRGLNLSKGQQARVNLARAVYKKSDIYLLDDPLNALDPNVQNQVFQKVIKGFLKNDTVVMVTHNQQHIKSADNLILISEGAIKYQGKQEEAIPEIQKVIEIVANVDKMHEVDEEHDEKSKLLPKTAQRKIFSEDKKTGKVNLNVYKDYFKYGGGFMLFGFIIIIFIGSEFSESFSARLLTNWINIQQETFNFKADANLTVNNTKYDELSTSASFTINLYSGMIISSAILDLFRQYFLLNFTRKASINIHKSMISRLIAACMSFYDKYFIGNILNRFSQDLGVIDEHLPHAISMFVMVLLHISGVVILVSSVSYSFLFASVVFVAISALVRNIYMPTARSLKRLEAATRSPLIGHLNASLEGVTTIRAYKAQNILEYEFDRHQDLYTSAHYMTLCVRRAFAFFMGVLSAGFVAIIIFKFLFLNEGEVAGNVGLAITKAASLAALVQWGLMQWSDLENDMTSVERVLEYTEIQQDNYDGQKLDNWPTKGAISFKDVSLSYGTEKVLKNVSFSIAAKQKLGIVGRTGAGKSSIISTLFRLYDFDGGIFIDGVNTKSLSLDFLRHSISIIPQDPVLFQGTIRMNIDPFNEFTDEDIWHTLEKVKMKDHIPSLGLTITDHGSNFSTGQRQLICLARSIIKNNKIVVLDEATANMDPETENLIQATIVENFSDCTVLIIAHRLQSVIDCNKILVMDRGEVCEFDDPVVLMQNEDSYFSKMLKSHEGFSQH